MKIKVNRDSFAKVFTLAVRATAVGGIFKDALKAMKITAHDGIVELMATDLELFARAQIEDAQVEEDGDVILPKEQLKRILQKVGADELSLTTDENNRVIVKGDKSVFKLATIDPDGFPDWPPLNVQNYHEMTQKDFKRMIKQTIYAVSKDGFKPTLASVLFEFGEDGVRMIATDGRRVASVVNPNATCHGTHEGTALLMEYPLTTFLKALDESDEMVQLSSNSTSFYFHIKGVTMTSRLQEGRFPEWRKVVPETDGRTKVVLDAHSLADAVNQADIVVNEASPATQLDFTNDGLHVSSTGVGEFNVDVPTEKEGDDVSIRINPRYLMDFLGTVAGNLNVFLQENQPLMFQDQADLTYVLMPLG